MVSYGSGSTVDNGTFDILRGDGRIKKPNVLNVLEDEHLERLCGSEPHLRPRTAPWGLSRHWKVAGTFVKSASSTSTP